MIKNSPFAFIASALLALHLTAFAVAVQLGVLIFSSLFAKALAWSLAALSWGLLYKCRSRNNPQGQPPIRITRTRR